jgi:hypothetical protein
VEQELRNSDWDEGVIAEFMAAPNIVGNVWEFGDGHRLFLWIPDALRDTYGPRIIKQLHAILTWLRVPRPFTTMLWWRDDPRILEAGACPTRREVNGGWTSAGSDTIFIYRSEEWDRVVFHELIHALEWDWKMPATPLPCWGLPRGSRIQPTLFEAWTELLAESLWCQWHDVPWSKQLVWSRRQALQIIACHGDAPWRENTSVFAYYVLKAALAPYIQYLRVYGIQDHDPAHRNAILCRLAGPELAAMRAEATQIVPERISLRMTTPHHTEVV